MVVLVTKLHNNITYFQILHTFFASLSPVVLSCKWKCTLRLLSALPLSNRQTVNYPLRYIPLLSRVLCSSRLYQPKSIPTLSSARQHHWSLSVECPSFYTLLIVVIHLVSVYPCFPIHLPQFVRLSCLFPPLSSCRISHLLL